MMETHATTTNTFLLLSGCVCYIMLYIYISLALSVNYTTSHIIQVIHHYTTICVSIPGFDAELSLTFPLVPLDPDWEPVFMTCPAQVWIACRALTLSFRKNGPLLWVNQEKQEETSINRKENSRVYDLFFLSWGSCHWASLPNITYVYIYIYIHTIYSYDPSSSNAPELRKQKRWPS